LVFQDWTGGVFAFQPSLPHDDALQTGDNHAAPVRFYDFGISAGFSSPAQDYEEPCMHINDIFIKHPETTFIAKAGGDSMIGTGINDGDMLLVDRGLTNYKDRVVIA